MKCPSCGYEPTDALLQSPCPICNGGWMDTYEYVSLLANKVDSIETVLDVGCGTKGVIAQHFWENVRPIKRGYACDRFVLKALPPLWEPLLCDVAVLNAPVDFVTHCGMLEHVEYEHAFRVLEAIEKLAGKFCFFTCSAELRQVDYKVKRDGNPYHYYRSWWDAKTFELLGYHVDRDRMISGQTFRREVVGWFDRRAMAAAPFAERAEQAKKHIAERRCCIPGCNAEPIAWDCRENDNYYCIVHYVEHGNDGRGDVRDVEWWLEQPNVEELIKDCRPPWRAPLQPLAR